MNKDLKLKESRFNGLTDTIDYYFWQTNEGFGLSPEQREQLEETRNAVSCFGEIGTKWAELADEILGRKIA